MISFGYFIAFLQPDLAEGEEVINGDIMELKERLHEQVS